MKIKLFKESHPDKVLDELNSVISLLSILKVKAAV
jgi:hypothetical protein